MPDELEQLRERVAELERHNALLLEREREWASLRQCKIEAPEYAAEDIEAALLAKRARAVDAAWLTEWIGTLQAAAINFESDWIPVRVVTKLHRGVDSVRVECKLQKPYMYELEVIDIERGLV